MVWLAVAAAAAPRRRVHALVASEGAPPLCPARALSSPHLASEHGPTAAAPIVYVTSDCAAFDAGRAFEMPYPSDIGFQRRDLFSCAWPDLADQRAWLAAVESDSSAKALRCYYGRVYPGLPAQAAVNASGLMFFWAHVPTLGAVDRINVTWVTGFNGADGLNGAACPMPDRTLWALWNDASFYPATFTCSGAAQRCGCANRFCSPRVLVNTSAGAQGGFSPTGASAGSRTLAPQWACAVGYQQNARMDSLLRFPGFWAFRNDSESRASGQMSTKGVADDTWVEVLRIARLDDRFDGPNAPSANSVLDDERATVGQVWFWVARGSGVWLNVGRSLVMPGPHNPSCRDAHARGYDTIQLTRSYGFSFELIDCRGQERPDANVTYEPACPPSHIELRSGLPTPRDAPALAGVKGGSDAACACDHSYDFLNCLGGKAS